MSQRGTLLMERATRQIDEIAELFAALGETDLARPSLDRPGRTVGEEAAHIAEGYHFMGRFLESAGYPPGAMAGRGVHGRGVAPTLSGLRERLSGARAAIARLAGLTDEQLDDVPPAKTSRFSDGSRNLEQVIEEVIDHQAGHLTELKRAVGIGELSNG